MTTALGSLFQKLPDNTFEGVKHRVVPRDEARVMLDVEVYPVNGATIAGQHMPHGNSRVMVYESEMAAVLERVCTPEQTAAWAKAEAQYAKMLAAYLDKECGPIPADADADYIRKRNRAAGRYAVTSPSKIFADEFPSGRPPLKSCEIVKTAPAPETPETKTSNQMEKVIGRLAEAILGAKQDTSAEPRAARARG